MRRHPDDNCHVRCPTQSRSIMDPQIMLWWLALMTSLPNTQNGPDRPTRNHPPEARLTTPLVSSWQDHPEAYPMYFTPFPISTTNTQQVLSRPHSPQLLHPLPPNSLSPSPTHQSPTNPPPSRSRPQRLSTRRPNNRNTHHQNTPRPIPFCVRPRKTQTSRRSPQKRPWKFPIVRGCYSCWEWCWLE